MELIKFVSTDNIELNGILYKSENAKNKKIILAVHGMTSNCLKKRDEIIAKKANDEGIDYFCFNNRGSEITKYIERKGSGRKELGGTAYEDVLDGYYDICGAILKLVEIGYKNIYLQGHSLGCTKIVYTYNKLKDENSNILEYIKGVILLSLVNIPATLRVFLGDNYNKYLGLAEEKEKEGKELELMPKESFIHPVSAKTFLRYIRDNQDFDFVDESKDPELSKINNIDVPLFMRWGNINELILEDAKTYSEKIDNIVKNHQKDISYIDGADHGYHNKETKLANEIIKFVCKYWVMEANEWFNYLK